MIPARIRRVWMDENTQAPMVEHQPRHQRRKHLRCKGNLKHGLVVGTYFDVMPASQRDGKTLVDPRAQTLGLRATGRRIVIDVSVIACDLAGRSRHGSLWQIGHLLSLAAPTRYAWVHATLGMRQNLTPRQVTPEKCSARRSLPARPPRACGEDGSAGCGRARWRRGAAVHSACLRAPGSPAPNVPKTSA